MAWNSASPIEGCVAFHLLETGEMSSKKEKGGIKRFGWSPGLEIIIYTICHLFCHVVSF